MPDDRRALRWAALGESHSRASQVFAALLDDVVLRTYDEAAGLPGAAPSGVAIAAGAGQLAAIESLLGDAELLAARIELPEAASDRARVGDAVRAAGWAITAVAPSPVGTWVADLRRVEGDEPLLPFAAPQGAEVAQSAAWPVATRAQDEPAGRAGRVRGLGPRRLAVLAAALAVVLVLAVSTVAAVASGSLGAVIVVLLLWALALQGGTLLVALYVARHVRRTRVHRDQIDHRILRRIGVLEQRQKSARQQVRTEHQRTRQLVKGVSRGVENVAVQNSRAQSRLEEGAKRRHLSSARQVQALGQLDRLLTIKGPVPPMGGWAASPDLVVLVLEHLLEHRPKVVVECGSGVTTLFTALAIEQYDLDCRVVSLDHEEVFAGQTQRLLEKHGVAQHVDLRCVPLEATGLPGHDTPWYSRAALEGIENVGLMVIDGPPEMTGEQARYPALPLLREQLAPDAIVIMDDVIRAEDKRTAQRWAAENPEFDLAIRNDLEKYAGILTRVVRTDGSAPLS